METECKKCKCPGSVVLRKKDAYCEKCFMSATVHKFRSSLGKNRVLKPEENVLVALSQGISSAVLLDLVHSSVNMETHKKLLLSPHFVYIMGLTNDVTSESKFALDLIENCNGKGFDLYVLHASYASYDLELVIPNMLPVFDESKSTPFRTEMENLTLTEYNDFLQKINRRLLIMAAQSLDCDIIFTAETTTDLAAKLISSVAMGRGSQIAHDVGFMDTRNDNVKIIRPMKDIALEELYYYCQVKQLGHTDFEETKSETSIQSLIKKFVKNLEVDYPATVSTVCKTADKMGAAQSDEKTKQDKCSICESQIIGRGVRYTVLEATTFSKMMCTGETEPETIPDPDATVCYSCNKFNVNY